MDFFKHHLEYDNSLDVVQNSINLQLKLEEFLFSFSEVHSDEHSVDTLTTTTNKEEQYLEKRGKNHRKEITEDIFETYNDFISAAEDLHNQLREFNQWRKRIRKLK